MGPEPGDHQRGRQVMLSPAAEALLHLARGEPAKHAAGDAAELAADIERLSAQHQVDALCGWHWARPGRPALELPGPPGAAERLRKSWRQAYLHQTMRNERLRSELEELAAAFAAARRPVLFLKGAWLAFEAWPDAGARPVGDIDLCVHEADYLPALAVLEKLDLKPLDRLPADGATALHRSLFGGQLRFAGRGRRPLELHFRVINLGPPGAGEEWIWAQPRTFSLGGPPIFAPGPEAMLAHLLIHANQHGFCSLRFLHDIRWALARDSDQIDFERIAEWAGQRRCRTMAYFGLRLARELAGAVLPDAWLRALEPPSVERWRYELCWRLPAVRRLEAGRRAMALEAPLFYLLEMDPLVTRLRYLKQLAEEAGGVWTMFRQFERRVLGRSRAWLFCL